MYNFTLHQAIQSDAQKMALRASPEKINRRIDTLLLVRDPWNRLVSIFTHLVESKQVICLGRTLSHRKETRF